MGRVFACTLLILLGLRLLWAAPDAPNQPSGAASTEVESARDVAEQSTSEKQPAATLPLEEFRPRSMLKVQEHLLTRTKYPVVDVHVHPRVRLHDSPAAIRDFVKLMDAQNIAVCVSLDGGMGEKFDEHKQHLWTNYRDRFVIFANIDWRGQGREDDPATWDCQRPDFGRRMADNLRKVKVAGASGLKVFKGLGLEYRNPDGKLIRIDDPRWDPIWSACGELGLPVLIHTADPAAFFLPVDEKNERWEELRRHPDWSFYGKANREDLLEQFLHIVAAHPKTNFIGAHLANSGEDLAALSKWLDTYPNLYVDIAARINELGRQPYTARKFLIKYSGRVLFGTDGPRVPERLVLHWRFLETFDEFFPYAENAFPPQGFWRIYGIGLPDDVLKKIYFQNAIRLVPGVKERYEKYSSHQRVK